MNIKGKKITVAEFTNKYITSVFAYSAIYAAIIAIATLAIYEQTTAYTTVFFIVTAAFIAGIAHANSAYNTASAALKKAIKKKHMHATHREINYRKI
jgi:hypothetical protein